MAVRLRDTMRGFVRWIGQTERRKKREASWDGWHMKKKGRNEWGASY